MRSRSLLALWPLFACVLSVAACASNATQPPAHATIVQVAPVVGAPLPASPPATATAEPAREVMSEYVPMLGKRVTDPVVARYVDQRTGQFEISKFGSSVYYQFKKEGVCLLFEDDVLSTVFLYSEGYEWYRQFQGRLPKDVTFADDVRQIRRRLGEPNVSGGGGGQTTLLGPVATWDKWYFPAWSLHVQYLDNGHIQMVTLMTQERDPNRNKPDDAP